MTAHLRVRVQPGARDASLVGWMDDGTLKLRVSAAPEGGRANRAVAELLAARVGVRAAAVRVARGLASRSKVIEVEGLEEAELLRRLDLALAAAGGLGERPASSRGGERRGRKGRGDGG